MQLTLFRSRRIAHASAPKVVFDSDGGDPLQIADNLPIPGGGTTGPDIRLNPVIADNTEDEMRVFFTAVAG